MSNIFTSIMKVLIMKFCLVLEPYSGKMWAKYFDLLKKKYFP